MLLAEPATLLAQEGEGGSSMFFFLMIGGFILLMYFLMIRPQRKRAKETQQMQSSVAVGARVMTIGGLFGTVVDSDEETITLEASDDVFLVFNRQAVAKVEEEGDGSEEEPLNEVDSTITDEDLEKLTSGDEKGDDDDKGKGKDKKYY
ncbi:preprotein translocase subunit YajC [Natronoglycomyces albus]|uniref:Preprotein translocase subunit YajC n=1 Tax=Natronoglycomyces albus TaxID=2811108 RepID=A0A895XR01_9ACTN|nr:preprotein translocase subunit YajC [Natronoglycomyces albus]QSB04008.1 preprotein translocase subunit YajC [Natronoglycomyces albus]